LAAVAKSKIRFSIANETQRTAKITLPGIDDTSAVEPDTRVTFTWSGAGDPKPAKVRVGKFKADLDMADGCNYIIRCANGSYEIAAERAVRTE
jgi:hypothetical protein